MKKWTRELRTELELENERTLRKPRRRDSPPFLASVPKLSHLNQGNGSLFFFFQAKGGLEESDEEERLRKEKRRMRMSRENTPFQPTYLYYLNLYLFYLRKQEGYRFCMKAVLRKNQKCFVWHYRPSLFLSRDSNACCSDKFSLAAPPRLAP